MFAVNIAKIFGTTFFIEHLRWLHLYFKNIISFMKNPYKILNYKKKLIYPNSVLSPDAQWLTNQPSEPAFTCSNLTMETLKQGMKYVQSYQ